MRNYICRLQTRAAVAPRRAIAFLLWLLLTTALAVAVSNYAVAGDVTLTTPVAGNFQFRVTSYSEIPYRTVLHQQFDYSCGSAALATLLRFNYSRDTNESVVFKAMYAAGDQAKIQKLGFSLLDMKNYLASLGYQADGYRLQLDQLASFDTPAIALIQIGSYKHFVVIKGAVGNQLLIGDPAQGLRLYSADDFGKVWNGIAFMIHDVDTKQHVVFNSAKEWSNWSDAHPLAATILGQSAAQLTRDLRVIYQIRPNQILPSPFSQ